MGLHIMFGNDLVDGYIIFKPRECHGQFQIAQPVFSLYSSLCICQEMVFFTLRHLRPVKASLI